MATVRTDYARLALVVQVEENYGTYRAVARVVVPQADGDLHNLSWHGHGVSYGEDEPADAQRFAGLEISAYAGSGSWSSFQSDTDQQLWGFGIHYAPHRVENGVHAQAIARTFAQVERGMSKAESEDGYIRDGEFARYVMRAAKALRIPRVYVRNTPRAYAATGERYRIADFGTLQYWTEQVTEAIAKRELGTLVRG